MQYTFGLLGFGVKFEKQEFHDHCKSGWAKLKAKAQPVVDDAVVEVKQLKQKVVPSVVGAALVTLRVVANGAFEAHQKLSDVKIAYLQARQAELEARMNSCCICGDTDHTANDCTV